MLGQLNEDDEARLVAEDGPAEQLGRILLLLVDGAWPLMMGVGVSRIKVS